MSDLVERLRAVKALDYVPHAVPVDLCQEAAAELTRLRAANKALIEAADALVNSYPTKQHCLSHMWKDHEHTAVQIGLLRALARAVEAANE